jgi:hypothetical protein
MSYLALAAAAAVLVTFIIPVLVSGRQSGTSAQQFYVSPSEVAPRVVQNSSIVYGVGLAAQSPLLPWSASGAFWPSVAYLVFVALGLGLIWLVRRSVLRFIDDALLHDRSITVHEFLARCYGNDARVRAVAAALTLFAVIGLMACVMLGLATMIRPLAAGSVETDVLLAVVILVVGLSAVFAGNRGVMHGSQFQLGMIYLGFFGSTAGLLYLQISELGTLPMRGVVAFALIALVCGIIQLRRRHRYVDATKILGAANTANVRPPTATRLLSLSQKVFNIIVLAAAVALTIMAIALAGLELSFEQKWTVNLSDLAPSPGSPSLYAMTSITLILLPLLHPLVDIVNWQRLAAFAKSRQASSAKPGYWLKAFRQFCIAYAFEVFLLGLLICLFGAVAGLTFASPAQAELIPMFVTQLAQENDAISDATVLLFIVAVSAMAVATLASLFSAGLCAVGYDIAPLFRAEQSRSVAGEPGNAARSRLLTVLVMALLVFAVFHLAWAHFQVAFASFRFLALVVCFSSAQLAFAPVLFTPLILGRNRIAAMPPEWALASLLASITLGIVVTAGSLVTGNEFLLLSIVPASLGAAALIVALGMLSRRPPAPKSD